MPMHYTEIVEIEPSEIMLGDLGLSTRQRRKLRKHRRMAHALMGKRKKEFEAAKALLEQMIEGNKALMHEVSALARNLQAKGFTPEQIRQIMGTPKQVAYATMKETVSVIA